MKRRANFEILRVVAMAMIVAMHFMHKGGILQPLSGNLNIVNGLAWLIETFCNVAANCYVLIAGYFLVDAQWKGKKLVSLVAQVLFYSLLIPVVCYLTGIGEVGAWSVYEWIVVVLPLQMDHYWFATAYVLMYMLTPVLAAGVKQLSKKQLELTIGVLLIYFCVFKSISPVLMATDNYGYDYPWFICMFLIAAYIRLYETPEGGLQIGPWKLFQTGKKSTLSYLLTVVLIFGLSVGLSIVNSKIGKFQYYVDMLYSYNHILVLLASLACFFAFKHWEPKEGRLTGILCKVAHHTFGIYLIHENVVIRNLWPCWFGAETVKDSMFFVPYMLVAIVGVFAVGVLVDAVRKRIFKAIGI